MNKLFVVGLSSFLAMSTMTIAQTNAEAVAVTNTPVIAQTTLEKFGGTNLQEAVVDILRGAKNVSGEIYTTSKTAITKAVDFTMEQTPLVVQEFLVWKFVEALIHCLDWTCGAIFLYILARKLWRFSSDSDFDEGIVFAWILATVATIILIFNLSVGGMVMAKIKVAPRVYLIEYVADVISQRR